jgi:serine/threonine protein kinase
MLLAGRFANEEFVTRFHGEASAAAVLHHPNIVAIHEVGCEEGQHYFSMDYVAGRTLADITRDGPLPARRAAEYVRTLAVAMQHAHQHGIMHRDLKPSNVSSMPTTSRTHRLRPARDYRRHRRPSRARCSAHPVTCLRSRQTHAAARQVLTVTCTAWERRSIIC